MFDPANKTIQRKPRTGDRVGFGSFAGRSGRDYPGQIISYVVEPIAPRYVVTRVEDNLCWIAPIGLVGRATPQDAQPFIWRFNENGRGVYTYNQLARIFDRESNPIPHTEIQAL